MDRNKINDYKITEHARFEMKRRGISEEKLAKVLSAPGQIERISAGRAVYQSQILFDTTSKIYLLRVFMDVDREPPEVVTVYRTSKIEKYWKN